MLLCSSPSVFQTRVSTDPGISSVILKVNEDRFCLESLPNDATERMASVRSFFSQAMSRGQQTAVTVNQEEVATRDNNSEITVPVGTRSFILEATACDTSNIARYRGIWQIAVMSRQELERNSKPLN
jgi:hypothetical protein